MAAHLLYMLSMASAEGPFGIETDCAVRALLLDYAHHIQPHIPCAGALHVFDSLELESRCNATPPTACEDPAVTPDATSSASAASPLFVDYVHGDDASPGSKQFPLQTISKALTLAANGTVDAIFLRSGVHFLNDTLFLSPAHNNLLIAAYCSGPDRCEDVWLSGGIALPQARWRPYNVSNGSNIWSRDVHGAALAAGGAAASALHWLRDDESSTILDRARWPNRRPEDGTMDKPSLLDITHSSAIWQQPATISPAISKYVGEPSVPYNVTNEYNHWMVGIGGECSRFSPPAAAICNPNATGGGYAWDSPGPFFPTGLQLGNASALFPNSAKWKDMSQAMFTSWTNGWFTSHFDMDGPFVDNTLTFRKTGGVQGGRGWHFPLGSSDFKICTGDVRSSDCGPVKIDGLFEELDAENEFYFDKSASRLYLFYNASADELISSEKQCTASSCDHCGCGPCNSCQCGDYCYKYCAQHNCACTVCNGPNPDPWQPPHHIKPTPPPLNATLVVPYLKRLIVIQGSYVGLPASGQPLQAVVNVTIRGVGFRDAAATVLEPHGIPSSGDWSLQRTAAIFLEGTESVSIESCHFKYLGGLAYQLSGYNRNASVTDSDFAYIGGSAMTSWGYTSSNDPQIPAGVGINGTNGNQPHGTRILRNICREVGTEEKQSSCWFQAKTQETMIKNNLFFNGPRAMINLNDGFGGGNIISSNGLWNSCRESGDHGVINTWDRTPYLTTLRTGLPSLIPAYNNVSNNFFISNYNSFDGIDNDDGSSYYDISENVFYMNEGLKSDYHGHDKLYHGNINIGAGVCCFQFGFISGHDAQSNVPGPMEFYEADHADGCYDNRCIQRPGGSWIHGAYAILWGCNASIGDGTCAPSGKAVMSVRGNKLYREAGRDCPFVSGCDIACGMTYTNQSMLSIADFQAKCGLGQGASVHPIPSAATIAEWSRKLLFTPS